MKVLYAVLWIRIRIRDPVRTTSFSRIRIVIGDLQGSTDPEPVPDPDPDLYPFQPIVKIN
jgi:hypothetical protein